MTISTKKTGPGNGRIFHKGSPRLVTGDLFIYSYNILPAAANILSLKAEVSGHRNNNFVKLRRRLREDATKLKRLLFVPLNEIKKNRQLHFSNCTLKYSKDANQNSILITFWPQNMTPV